MSAMTSRTPIVFAEPEIRAAVTLNLSVVDCIESAFAALATRAVSMPPVMQIFAGESGGQTCVKGAWIEGYEAFAVKLSSIYPPPPGAHASEANGLMALVESGTGRILAVLLDNGRLTQIRTAAAGAVAARRLAPSVVRRLGVLGAGKQALLQAQAAHLVRPFEAVDVWARDAASAVRLARRIEESLPVSVRVVSSAAAAAADAQLVVTATSARTPLLRADDLHPGLHVTAVGSDAAGKRELHPDAILAADLYVGDALEQCRRLGELQGVAPQSDRPRRLAALGDIVAGLAEGRTSDAQLTIADLTGVGVQDTAIAVYARDALLKPSISEHSV